MIPRQALDAPIEKAAPPPAEVRQELDRILASKAFARSDRMCRFLRFIVDESVNGRGEQLKEAVIGVRVFDRPVSYNPASDPVVRVEARRLRSKLEDYYAGEGSGASLIFELPKGSYAPLFRTGSANAIGQSRRWPKMGVAIAAAVVITAMAYWVIARAGMPAVGAPAASVAVLPIAAFSPDPNVGYFCDGLTEQLIFSLSQVDGLRVPGRTSSFQFRQRGADLRTIGKTLGVRNVLEGSVRAAGDRLRITLQLLSVDTGYHLWSHTYERELRDIFALQDEISRAVVNALEIRVAGIKPAPTKRYSADAAALKLYFEGRQAGYEGDVDKAISLIERAIQKDPGFGLAYAALARVYTRSEDPAAPAGTDSFPKTKAAAQRALEIDGTAVEAVIAVAVARLYEWDWPGAEREFQRAFAMDRHSADVHGTYAIGYLAAVGRLEEAVRESAKGVELEPLSLVENNRYGTLLRWAERYNQSIAQMEKTVRIAPQSATAIESLGKSYLQAGLFDRALEQFRSNPLWTAVTLARAGRKQEAMRVRLPSSLNGMDWAAYYVALEDKDRAFESLETAYRQKRRMLVQIAVDSFWKSLRTDPRYKKLLAGMGLKPAL